MRGGLDEPSRGTQVQERPKPPPDIDYLQVRSFASTYHFERRLKALTAPQSNVAVLLISLDSLQELLAMQQNGPKNIGFFGTRNMGFMHQNLIEILSYAMVLTVRQNLLELGVCVPCSISLTVSHAESLYTSRLFGSSLLAVLIGLLSNGFFETEHASGSESKDVSN